MGRFVLGVVVTMTVGALGALLLLKSGLISFEASASPSALETKVATMALNASVARHAPHRPSALPPSDTYLLQGLNIYRTGCADCHGVPGQGNVYGRSFYPPVPQFAKHPPRRSEGEIYYIVKQGVRMTGMAAWGNLMDDEKIWKVSAFLSRLDSLPPAVAAEWQKTKH